MPSSIHLDEPLTIGDAFCFAESPSGKHAVVFEDDGQTGYFYACKAKRGGPGKVLNALHIYNTTQIVDADTPSRVQIVWSDEGRAAALIINDYPHAVFDFKAKRASCRTGFPESGGWRGSHEWDESLLELFK